MSYLYVHIYIYIHTSISISIATAHHRPKCGGAGGRARRHKGGLATEGVSGGCVMRILGCDGCEALSRIAM